MFRCLSFVLMAQIFIVLINYQCNKMINGVSLSEIGEVNRSQMNHYQKLDCIINTEQSRFSLMNKSLERVIQNHKSIHEVKLEEIQVAEYRFRKIEYRTEIKRGNEFYNQKLLNIRMSNSRYNFKQKESFLVSKGHHFYIRKRKEIRIDTENPEIAERIINSRGDLSMSKAHQMFQKSQELVRRLQKFPIIQRMNEISEKRLIARRQQLAMKSQSYQERVRMRRDEMSSKHN